MGITTNTRNTFQPKVEQGDIETGFLEEWHNEASQAAVDMHPNVMFKCDFGECGDVVHATIREVNSRADKLKNNQIKMASDNRILMYHDRVRVAIEFVQKVSKRNPTE